MKVTARRPKIAVSASGSGLGAWQRRGYAQNQIWREIVALACELLAWMQMLALPGPPADGNPNGSACGFSPSPVASSAAAGGCDSRLAAS